MRQKLFKNGNGEWKVRVEEEDPDGVKVTMLEDSPFAEQGDTQWVAPRFVKDIPKQSP